MKPFLLMLLLIGTGAGLAGHIFIAWGLWILMGLIAVRSENRREKRRAYWRQRRNLQDAYMRTYLRNNGYRY